LIKWICCLLKKFAVIYISFLNIYFLLLKKFIQKSQGSHMYASYKSYLMDFVYMQSVKWYRGRGLRGNGLMRNYEEPSDILSVDERKSERDNSCRKCSTWLTNLHCVNCFRCCFMFFSNKVNGMRWVLNYAKKVEEARRKYTERETLKEVLSFSLTNILKLCRWLKSIYIFLEIQITDPNKLSPNSFSS